jgi:hypothetical protein
MFDPRSHMSLMFESFTGQMEILGIENRRGPDAKFERSGRTTIGSGQGLEPLVSQSWTNVDCS